MITFKITGTVKEKESGIPLTGLFVKAYDKDLLFDDLLGSAITDRRGEFEIVAEPEDFREFFDVRPDIYFKVYRGDRRTLVHTTEDAVRWGAGRVSAFEILIPWEKLHDPAETRVVLMGDDDTAREAFGVGESLTIQARGLRPVHAHDVSLHVDSRELFTCRLLTNNRGELEPTVVWPQMGLDDPNSEARYTPDEAMERWAGKMLTVTLVSGKQRIAEQTVEIVPSLDRPLVLATEPDGRLLNGFEIGSQPLFLTLSGLPFGGRGRIYMVDRQHDWREGDSFEPATLADGRPAVHEVDLPEDGSQAVIEFAAADVLLPGAYDFIVRPLRYGFEDNDATRVLATDAIGGRRTTGVVIREHFLKAKPVLGGCVNRIPMSGRTVAGAPYFRYSDTFETGENVYAALDPGIVAPGNIGKMCALYVIPSKDAAAWSNNSLSHLAVLGGNTQAQRIKVQAGCVNYNKVLVWSGASQLGEYDIVADFGNNQTDASLFVPDHKYDTPLDIIDGYLVAGFRVVDDPGTLSDFAHAGNWNYTETDVTGMGLQGTVQIQDENKGYHTPGGFSTINRTVQLKAHVYFPANSAGITDPAQISTTQPDYPLIVVVHGNWHDYTTYDFLLEHFAKNGFIAASIDLRHVAGSGLTHDMRGLGRANVLFKHLAVLEAKFGSKLQNNIGIMGHSRGGEGVVKAARLNKQQTLGHNINAIISLAPTDQYGSEVLGGAWATPYFVLYGSRDGDISGAIWTTGYTVPQTGFALYDRASGARKSMVFVYRATHNGFITDNHDGPWDGENLADLLAPATQKKITKAYMNAFFRQYLKNEPKWEGMFTGEWQPKSVAATGARLYIQHRNPDQPHKTVDDFEGATANWQSSTIGGTVSHDDASSNPTLPVDPQEGRMHDHTSAAGLDPKSPHDTKGLRLRWDNPGDHLVFSIPSGDKDVSGYSVLSFRITQKVDSTENTANQPQNLRVALKDSSNNERAIRVSAFSEIPFPDHRANHAHSKSAMNTIRIPLTSYTIVAAGQPKVDLEKIVSLSFVFSEKPKGEIEIDEIEFSG